MKCSEKSKSYTEPEMQVIYMSNSDILVQSGGIDLPLDPL